jgi:hypothetical protein
MQDYLFEDFKPNFLTKITQVDLKVIDSFLVIQQIFFLIYYVKTYLTFF